MSRLRRQKDLCMKLRLKRAAAPRLTQIGRTEKRDATDTGRIRIAKWRKGAVGQKFYGQLKLLARGFFGRYRDTGIEDFSDLSRLRIQLSHRPGDGGISLQPGNRIPSSIPRRRDRNARGLRLAPRACDMGYGFRRFRAQETVDSPVPIVQAF